MELLGYVGAALIGVSLGLIGGGGSILTVPVLVYLFRVEPILATSYSLFIVGLTSLVGAIPKYKHKLIDIKTAIVFGLPSILSVFLTRKFLMPAIPDHIATIAGLAISKSMFIMVIFAVLMLFASYSMIRSSDEEESEEEDVKRVFNYPLIILEGFIVGALTGLVGAGGGFLIIPALVILSKLPIKQAIGTSLLIIGAKSLIGFTGDLGNMNVDWSFLALIASIAVFGMFIGHALSKRISSGKLKKGFGWFVLAMGVYIITKELFI